MTSSKILSTRAKGKTNAPNATTKTSEKIQTRFARSRKRSPETPTAPKIAAARALKKANGSSKRPKRSRSASASARSSAKSTRPSFSSIKRAH